MFYFTKLDPNFRIKGSRDPLGFQSIWQSLGRNVIKYLSTVSNNIRDFQVLSYAWYFFGDRNSDEFMRFFYKFEQACAYARGIYIEGDAFNGIDFVRKRIPDGIYTLSNKDKDTILSNQKAYGVYGKYNRPFTEMGIKESQDFSEVIGAGLSSKVNLELLRQKVESFLSKDEVRITKEELEIFSKALSSLSKVEKEFYMNSILKVNGADHVQNELFDLIKAYPQMAIVEQFNLYDFIETVKLKDISADLATYLEEIKVSEKVLTPYTYLFKTIQSSPTWTEESLVTKPIFKSLPTSTNHQFRNEVVKELNDRLNDSAFEKAVAVTERNIAVCKVRNNAPWVKKEGQKLTVSYFDGGRDIGEFDCNIEYQNTYFIPAYLSLYNQIMN